jgi:hypothetical protein
MGGGFPNTELRSLSDARVLSFDFITLDDGGNRRTYKCITSSAVEYNINEPSVGKRYTKIILPNRLQTIASGTLIIQICYWINTFRLSKL